MNNQKSDTDTLDGQFCRQQVLRVRPLFRLSYPYTPEPMSRCILALYAFFSALEESISMVSDEVVARTKLNFWQQQLCGNEYSISSHPITRQLYRCELLSPSTIEDFRGLLNLTIDRLDAPALTNEQALKFVCQTTGLKQVKLELGIEDNRFENNDALNALSAVNGLVQLLRESSRSQISAYSWLPLNLLARFELTRTEIESGSRPEKTQRLIQYLCALGLSWTRVGGRKNQGPEFLFDLDERLQHGHRHCLVLTALNIRQLETLSGVPPQRYIQVFTQTGPVAAWLAWRTARRLTRRR